MIIYSSTVSNSIENFTRIGIEINISEKGLPTFDIYGMISKTIEESKKRILNSFESCNINFPLRNISINLAPAEISKEGTHYDFAIAVGILKYTNNLNYNEKNDCFIGELSFNGDLRKLNNAFYLCMVAKELGFSKIYLPFENLEEISFIDGVEIYGVKNLGDVLLNSTFKFNYKRIDPVYTPFNFSKVIGNSKGKRALSLALSGKHHLLLEGYPGTGKSMIAKTAAELSPCLNEKEALSKATLYSYLGNKVHSNEMYLAPFRSPHNSSSYSAIFGGNGKFIYPGEVALSNKGVLFLDEFPEFNRLVIEGLRIPLEEKSIVVSRSKVKKSFETDFILIATRNPCKCGYFEHDKILCKCTPFEIKKYQARISGPILDRIDINIRLNSKIDIEATSESENYSYEEFSKLRIRILETRLMLNGLNSNEIEGNNHLNALGNNYITRYLSDKSISLIKILQEKYSLSNRKIIKLINLSKTISFFDLKDKISEEHILEAVSLSQFKLY
jgi:magnesium chelatase family protein